ncbi:unnamed protein product [Rotaria sordida]|uniref:Uncharacterized protein n=1 Tax=Rotaria sordida TaxID=392033 RepID=A0A819VQG2_9BILA|nr:unnamed protein product [Rotaria sordida]
MEQNLNNSIENHNDHSDGSTNGATNINGNHNDAINRNNNDNHSNCVNLNDIANHNDSLNPNNNETNNHSLIHNINANISGNINNSINLNNNSNTNNIINQDQNEETEEDIVEIVNIQNNNEPNLLKINQINIDIDFPGLSIRTVDPAYKKLPHDYQLITTETSKAKKISGTIINKYLKLKHVKVDWFNGSRTLISMPNTRVAIV